MNFFNASRHGGASHAFGIAADRALKQAMDNLPAGLRESPYKYLPELVDHAKRWFSERTRMLA